MPLCTSCVGLPTVLTFLIVLLISLSRSFTAASNEFSAGTQKTTCSPPSAEETVMLSPSGVAFQPFGTSNLIPPSLWVKTLASCAESDDLVLSVLAGCSFLSVSLVEVVFLSPPPLQARANTTPSINTRIRFSFFKLVPPDE